MYLIQVSICSLLFYLLFHFCFKESTRFHFTRFYLLGSLLLSLIIPIISLAVYPEFLYVSKATLPEVGTVVIEEKAPFISWSKVLFSVYFVGLIVSMFFLIKRLVGLIQIISQSTLEKHDHYTIVRTDEKIALSTFLHFLFISKKETQPLEPFKLMHEETHIRQKHSWDLLFLECAKCFLWFNPVLFYYKKSLVEVHEYLADQGPIQHFGKDAYVQFLINQVSRSSISPLVTNFYSLFKQRIIMINENKPMPLARIFLLAPVLLLLLSFFSFKSYPVYVNSEGVISNVALDSIPQPYSVMVYDTVVIFDMETMEEKITIISRKVSKNSRETPQKNTNSMKDKLTIEASPSIDTIVIFDDETYKQMIITLDNITGKRDTIKDWH